MDFLKKNKTAIGAVVVIALLVYVYFAYFSSSSSATVSSTDANTTLSQNLLVTLQNLHTIKLDNSIFTDPAFLSLTDFGVTIPPENIGRRNPFLPASGSGTAANSSLNSTITLPSSK